MSNKTIVPSVKKKKKKASIKFQKNSEKNRHKYKLCTNTRKIMLFEKKQKKPYKFWIHIL